MQYLYQQYFLHSSDMSVEHLRVCTMEQALADVNNFISTMNTKYKFNNPKWITFGGSYSGINGNVCVYNTCRWKRIEKSSSLLGNFSKILLSFSWFLHHMDVFPRRLRSEIRSAYIRDRFSKEF